MFRPSIQKVEILLSVAILSVVLFYIVSLTVVFEKKDDYDLKKSAAEEMSKALEMLKSNSPRQVEGMGSDEFIWSDRDPFDTRLIFNRRFSPLLTDIGKYQAKATVLKPNFAAFVINEFSKAGLEEGDTVAISMTGSMPGANIAVLVACKVMGLEYVSISSFGASEWGANDMSFSWPKMEKLLYEYGNGIYDNGEDFTDNNENGVWDEGEVFDDRFISHTSNKFTYGGAADYLKQGEGIYQDYGGKDKRKEIDDLMLGIYPDVDRTELKELFLLHDLYAGDDSNEGFAINRKNPLPIDREHYALAINIARRLEVYDQANTIDNNKHLISEMIDKHYDVQSGDTIYISNIATVDRSDKNQILKDFEANFDLDDLLDSISYEDECNSKERVARRDKDKLGIIAPETLSALLYICDEKGLKCLEQSYLETIGSLKKKEKYLFDSLSLKAHQRPFHDVNCNGIYDKRYDHRLKLDAEYSSNYKKNISDNYDLSHYKAYINVGGSVASFGLYNQKKLEKSSYGFVLADTVKNILKNEGSKRRGVITHFIDQGIPIINFIEIEKLLDGVDLKYFNREISDKTLDMNEDGMIDIGLGNLYHNKKYNLIIVWLALIINMGLIGHIGITSYRQITNQMRDYNPND